MMQSINKEYCSGELIHNWHKNSGVIKKKFVYEIGDCIPVHSHAKVLDVIPHHTFIVLCLVALLERPGILVKSFTLFFRVIFYVFFELIKVGV